MPMSYTIDAADLTVKRLQEIAAGFVAVNVPGDAQIEILLRGRPRIVSAMEAIWEPGADGDEA